MGCAIFAFSFVGFSHVARQPHGEHKVYSLISHRSDMSFARRVKQERTPAAREDDPSGSCFDRSSPDCSECEAVKGYEYLHPDITALLLTQASWNLGEAQDCPFEVDPASLIMYINPKKIHAVESLDVFKFMPLQRLAYLAEECERAVFSTSLQSRISNEGDVQKVSGKILGLICLSQLPPSQWPTQNECFDIIVNTHIRKSETKWPNAPILVATMVSLNLLESSIRTVLRETDTTNCNNNVDQRNGIGAPLLRDMIETISEIKRDRSEDFKVLASILRTLLLPTRMLGINLRNLISHGFLSSIERRWLALTIVLIQTFDSYICDGAKKDVMAEITFLPKTETPRNKSLRKYDLMSNEIIRGQKLLLKYIDGSIIDLVSNVVPDAHSHISEFIFETLATPLRMGVKEIAPCSKPDDSSIRSEIPSLTTIFLIAASSLLEHSLRLQWCRANNRPEECIARPSKYYVTLDGHGQRDKHDVMISPYLRDGSKNLLIPQIGAGTCALLSDLFSAPSLEAPNIRSQLCHGAWDSEVIKELEMLAHWMLRQSHNCPGKEMPRFVNASDTFLDDAAFAVTSLLEMLSCNLSGMSRATNYQSVYSYTAMWTRDLDTSITELFALEQLISSESFRRCIQNMENQKPTIIFSDLIGLEVQLDMLRQIQQKHFPTIALTSRSKSQDIESDYSMNTVLSECTAAQTLLAEATVAIRRYLTYVQGGLGMYSSQPNSTKQRRSLKTMTRILGVARTVFVFYTLSVYVCLVMAQNALLLQSVSKDSPCINGLTRADFVKVVERTRMTLSTFDSYLEKNLDRSLKALTQYVQGKALRKVISQAK
ncbi:hypothetical protein ACHAW6_012543 [Cyclotella cf. meneghiniana]